jgi:hypothetical protein
MRLTPRRVRPHASCYEALSMHDVLVGVMLLSRFCQTVRRGDRGSPVPGPSHCSNARLAGHCGCKVCTCLV